MQEMLGWRFHSNSDIQDIPIVPYHACFSIRCRKLGSKEIKRYDSSWWVSRFGTFQGTLTRSIPQDWR